MKVFSNALAALAITLPVAFADFDIDYIVVDAEVPSKHSWALFDGQPTCADLDKDDVVFWTHEMDRETARGINCLGAGCQPWHGEIDAMELHFTDDYAWTILESDGYNMWNTRGVEVGECELVGHDTDAFRCPSDAGDYIGIRKVHCEIDYADAKNINRHANEMAAEDEDAKAERLNNYLS